MKEHLSISPAATESLSNQPTKSESRRAFLHRQVQGEATRPQIIFDITFGIVLPILCLIFDPLVFRAGISGRPLAGEIQLFAYGFIAIQIIALAVWLALGSRAGEWCGVLGGIMYAGTVFSFVIGVCLLPFSLIGLVILVGALGFTPFLTAFIYQRNTRRARKAAGAHLTRAGGFATLLFGATLALGAPAFVHWRINKLIERSVAEVLGRDDAQAADAAHRLRYVRWLASVEIDEVVWAYGKETDLQRKERLARAYREMTGGGDISRRLNVLYD